MESVVEIISNEVCVCVCMCVCIPEAGLVVRAMTHGGSDKVVTRFL